jgi:prepilin signal peptidase PulO-like enzyme (type II secretory pathway)
MLIIQKIKTKSWELNTQVPFWPFIAIWFFLTIFYQEQINNLLKIYFL